MSSEAAGYQLARLFAIRPAGVPFDVLEQLATPRAAASARELLERSGALAAEVRAVTAEIRSCAALSPERRARLLNKVAKRVPIERVPELATLERYHQVIATLADAERALDELLAHEYAAARERLYAHAAAELPAMAIVQLTHAALATMLEAPSPRSDRSLATWLQRVCAKNDTISRFGPSAWGTIDADEPVVRLAPAPGIARSSVWVERWVVHALIDVIDRDPDVRAELAPRRCHADAELAHALAPDERALLERCDGRTPAHALGDAAVLARLAERGLVRWRLEPLFIDDDPFATLVADVAAWRDGPPRQRWIATLRQLGELAAAYRDELVPDARRRITEAIHALLAGVGVAARERTGRLYEAANPLVEDCTRSGDFALGQRVIDQLIEDATPWFDLYRDACSVARATVYERLRELHVTAPRHHGRLSLAAFMGHAEASGASLAGPALGRFAAEAFRDIRTRFARRLAHRADAPEWELTVDECRFLAGPDVPRADIQAPSVDLQLAAESVAAVARGEYRWVLSELHHHLAPMGQALAWSCPDRGQLCEQLARAHEHPTILFHDTIATNDVPVHASFAYLLDGVAGARVVTSRRTRATWRTYAPDAVDIVLDEAARDVRARCARTGADLGTLFPLPRFFIGLHPFFPLQLDRHTPRLVRGRTVLQRRAWVIEAEELGGARRQSGGALVLAVERLRAARDLPRWVFMRVRDDVLAGSDPNDRLKDLKPICLDLESYVFLKILAHRLAKWGTVELVEMLPAPHELLWHEPDGRRTFELRTNLVRTEP